MQNKTVKVRQYAGNLNKRRKRKKSDVEAVRDIYVKKLEVAAGRIAILEDELRTSREENR